MCNIQYTINAGQGNRGLCPKYTNPHNYKYDEIGNLVRDSIEEIDTINWMVTGKIKSIIRRASSLKDNLYFDYDAQGNRIAKHNYTSANVWKHSTYYVRDAQGNVMSVYDKKPVTPFMSYKLSEQHIYGSSRLGMTNPGLEMIGATASIDTVRMYLGFKHYELSNHLGNVLTTISDKKIQIGYTGCPMSLDFNSGNTTGMQTDNALLSTATQSLEVTPLSAFAGVNAVFTSTPGVTYNIQFTFNNNTTNATDGFVITAYDFDGTTYSNITNLQIGLPANGVNSYTYTAGPSTSFVKFYYTSGLNVPTHSFYIDDLSICSPSSTPTPTVVDHYIADISSATDYYAFGQEQWGRKFQSRNSVDGFNSKRKDDDVKGDGNSYDFGSRIYDPRLGRFLSIDPDATVYPYLSTYCFAASNPIKLIDENGRGPIPPQRGGGYRPIQRTPTWLDMKLANERSNSRRTPNSQPWFPPERVTSAPYEIMNIKEENSGKVNPKFPSRMNVGDNTYSSYEAMEVIGKAIKNVQTYNKTVKTVAPADYNENTGAIYRPITVTIITVDIPKEVLEQQKAYEGKVKESAQGKLTTEEFNKLPIQEQTLRYSSAKVMAGQSPNDKFTELAKKKFENGGANNSSGGGSLTTGSAQSTAPLSAATTYQK